MTVLDQASQFHVRLPRDLGEIYQVALLRAECYYEGKPFTRYVRNFVSEYARAEFNRLKTQQADRFRDGKVTCLVCVDRSRPPDRNVVASIDVCALGLIAHRLSVPDSVVEGDAGLDSYISNFCVLEECRRNKLGTLLMSCAIAVLCGVGGGGGGAESSCEEEGGSGSSSSIYAHVNRGNEAALLFYRRNGFVIIGHQALDLLMQAHP